MLKQGAGAVAVALLVVVTATTGARRARAAEPAPVEAPDPAAARSLAVMARAGLEARHPEEAALLFERAFDLDPHPLWQVAAGAAWLEAIEPARAVERLAAAVESPLLAEVARTRAREQLALARKLAALVGVARHAEKAGDWREAARAWEEAFRFEPLGRLAFAAGRAAERAAAWPEAARLYALAAERQDLAVEEERALGDARARVANVTNSPAAVRSPSPSGAPYVLIVSGGAVLVGGVAALLVGAAADRELERAEVVGEDGLVHGTTRAEAADLADRAQTWLTAGWIAVGVGAVTAALGTGWLVSNPPRGGGAVQVVPAASLDGLGLRAVGSF